MYVALLELALLKIELSYFFMHCASGQATYPNTLLPYHKRLFKALVSSIISPSLLIKDAKIQKTITTSQVSRSKYFLTYGQCLSETCNSFRVHILLKVENPD